MRLQSLLLIACLMLSSMAFAQQEDQIQIKINTKDGDKTIVIDTSFNFSGDTEKLKDLLKEFNIDHDFDFDFEHGENIEIFMDRNSGKQQRIVIIGDDEKTEKMPLLGVYLDDPEETTETGAHITSIIEGTGAEKAGLQKGDIITKANGTKINNTKELIELIQSMEPDDELKLTYLREGKKEKTTAVLGTKKRSHAFSFGHTGHGPMIWKQDCDKMIQPKPYLGVHFEHKEDAQGVVITNVESESAAQAAGLQEGDVIIGIDGESIANGDELVDAIRGKKIGDEITILYQREGQSQTARATLGEKKMMDKHFFKKHHWNHNSDMREQLENLRDNLDQYDSEELREKLDEILKEKQDHSRGFFFGPGGGDVEFNRMVIVIEVEDITEAEAANLNLSTDNNLTVEDLRFSPNPSNGAFNLSFALPESGDVVINILDINGRSVYQEVLSDFVGTYNGQIDISGEAQGVYFLQLLQNDRSQVKKIVIQ